MKAKINESIVEQRHFELKALIGLIAILTVLFQVYLLAFKLNIEFVAFYERKDINIFVQIETQKQLESNSEGKCTN